MFPIPNRDNKFLIFNPSSSPSDRHHSNKSTHLPYFKRFPNSKFLSQQRKRIQKFDFKDLTSPQKPNPNRASFFKKEKQRKDENKQQSKAFSSSILRPDRQFKKKKLIKQLYEREGTKLRHKTDLSQENRRSSIRSHKSPKNIHENVQKVMTPLQILKNLNNLQPYEKQQIMNYHQVYYHGQNCKQKKSTLLELTKKDGSYNWAVGDHIHYQYQFIQVMGEGSFGEVFKCLDHKRGKIPIALKIVKDNEKYTNQAKTQVKILNYIKLKDPAGAKNCVHIRDFFYFRNRICMTFDLMSINLYQLIKNNGYYGLPLDLIRRMALQILNAIHFLHKNQIIHADLKPENILLKEANKSGVKVIDFGSSCFEKQTIYTYIQSRYYRAPQVILGLPYDRRIDIWSFACIIAELYLGYPLFAGDQQHEQICLVTQVLGLPPSHMSYSAKRWDLFFDKQNNCKKHPKLSEPGSKNLKTALENTQDQDFIDFILKCLTWTIEDRYQALDCLKHNWILKGLPEQIREQHLKFIHQENHQKISGGNSRKMSSFTVHNRSKFFH